MNVMQLVTESINKQLPLLQGEALEHCNRWLQDPYCLEALRNELILNDFHNVKPILDTLQQCLTWCYENEE